MNKLILILIICITTVSLYGQTAPIKKKTYVDEQKVLNVEAATPRTGYISAPYRKADGNWYEKTDAGVEQLIIDTVGMLATKYDLSNVNVDTLNEIATKYDIIKQLKYFANIAAIPTTLELGERIKIEDTGAEYFVQNTTVAGFNGGTADGVAVVDLGAGKYAVLQPNGDEINMSWFTGTDENKLNQASLFCASSNFFNTVLMDVDTIKINTGRILLRRGAIFKGTAKSSGKLEGRKGTVIIANYNDVTIPLFETDSTGGYNAGRGIINAHLIADNNALCGINLIHPEKCIVKNIEIDGKSLERNFRYGVIIKGSINQKIENVDISHIDSIGIHSIRSTFTGTTTTLEKCWINRTNIALKADSNSVAFILKDVIIETCDSSAVIIENDYFKYKYGHLEDVGLNGNSAIFDFGSKKEYGAIRKNYYLENMKISTGITDNSPIFKTDNVGLLSVIGSDIFANVRTLETTANSYGLYWESNTELTGTEPVYNLFGCDSSKTTIISSKFGWNSQPKSFINEISEPIWSRNGDDIYYNDGDIGIGTTTPTKKFHLFENATVGMLFQSNSQAVLEAESANANPNSLFSFKTSRGTVASPSIILAGNNLGTIRWDAYRGLGDYGSSASIEVVATQDFTGGSLGSNMQFKTTPQSFGGRQTMMEIYGTGQIKFNKYGVGSRTGTAAKYLAVESDGDVIEVDLAAGMDAVVANRSYVDNTAALVDLSSGQVYYNTTSSTFVVLP